MIEPGQVYEQVYPVPTGMTCEVESVREDRAVIRRPSGARQSVPHTMLTDYWKLIIPEPRSID